MATKIADIYAALGIDSSKYDSGLSDAQGKASSFGNILQGIFQGVGQRLFTGIVGGLESLVGKMGEAVQASSNLNESINKTGVVFGSSAQEVVKWSTTTADSLGISQQKALEAASGFGALARQMGGTTKESAAFGERLVGLAADLASFNNIDPTVALQKLKSGLAGESEPLKAVNVFLNENIVAQRAVQLGLAASTDSVSESAKVWARYSLILEQTKPQQGDFANTSEQLANAQRRLAAAFEDGSARLGDSFRPALASITDTLAGLVPQMFQYGQNITDQLANGLAAGIRAIIPVIQTVRQLFTYWFAPGSPPRVLPDIDKWGAAAMGQFLGGFSSVDVKGAFDTVGKAIESILRSNVAAGKGSENGLVGAVFGTRNAIQNAVAEFARAGSVSEATINKIVRSAGTAGPSIAALVKAYFNLQTATTAATRAQDDLNRITDQYDAILTPLQGKLDSVRAEQRKLADQQRLIAAQNVLTNFDSTAAEKRAAQLDIEQIQLESQISTVEDQKKAETDKAQAQLDGAKKAETAAQKQLDIAQATIDQQVEVNNLLAEQKRLTEQLAAAQEAAAKKAQAEAEQAANKAEQLAAKQQREADQLAAAQLRYRLQVSDTAGDIAIMEGELAKLTPGTVEYFDVLTQLDSLHKQYNAELERAAKAAGALGTTDIGAGLETGITGPLGEASEAGKNLAKALQEAFAPVGPASKNIQILGDKISLLVNSFGRLVGIDFSAWNRANAEATNANGWDGYGIAAKSNAEIAQKSIDETVSSLTKWVNILNELPKGNWIPLWNEIKAALTADFSLTGGGIIGYLQKTWTVLDGFVTKANKAWKDFWDGLAGSGKSLIDNIWGGAQGAWETYAGWWRGIWEWVRGLLPGSEPSDTSSPLSNLGDSGRALVNNIWDGIKEVWATLETWWTGALSAFVTAISAYLTPIYAASTAFLTQMWDGVKAAWKSISDWWSGGDGVLSAFITTIANYLTTIYTAGSTLLVKMSDGLKASWKTITDWWDGKDGVLTKFINSVTGLGSRMYEAGKSLLSNLWDGMKAQAPSLPGWAQSALKGITDQLPGSEPKDPTSPLAGLGKRGAALVENFQAGMDKASFSIAPLANSLLPSMATAGATSNDNRTSNSNQFSISLTINGNADASTVRGAAIDGLTSALRAAGMA